MSLKRESIHGSLKLIVDEVALSFKSICLDLMSPDASPIVNDKKFLDFQCCSIQHEDLHELMLHYEQSHQFINNQEFEIFPCSPIDVLSSCFSSSDSLSSFKDHPSHPLNKSDSIYSADSHTCSLSDIYKPQAVMYKDPDLTDSEDEPSSKRYRQSRSDSIPELIIEDTSDAIEISDTNSDIIRMKRTRSCSLSILDPQTGERKYICQVETCGKQYKNANGLKYHLSHAHSDGVGVPAEFILAQKRKDSEDYRPYACSIQNCGKRYKNLNGLKYHIEHAHSAILPPSFKKPTIPTPVSTPPIPNAIHSHSHTHIQSHGHPFPHFMFPYGVHPSMHKPLAPVSK